MLCLIIECVKGSVGVEPWCSLQPVWLANQAAEEFVLCCCGMCS